mgnify:CR=1 FL=1
MLTLGIQLNTISINNRTVSANTSPLDIGSLAYYFDLSNANNVTLNPSSANFLETTNLGTEGTSFVLTNTTTADQPEYTNAGSPLGLSYANFDGGNEFLYIADTSDKTTPASINLGINYSIFAVVDNQATNTVSGITGGRNPNTFVFRFLNNTTQLSNTVFAGSTTTETVAPANPDLIGSAISTIGGVDGTLRTLWNGEESTPSSYTGTPVSNSDIFVGKSNNSAQYFLGRIYEIGFFTKELTNREIEVLNNYAKNKYNINF